MFKQFVVFIFFLVSFPLVSFASVTDWTHFGIRPLAMGNAFVAVADDYNAIFYNPAGIGLKDGVHFQLFGFTAAMSSSFFSLFRDIKNLDRHGESGDVLDLVEKNLGSAYMLDLSWTPYLSIYNFAFAIGVDAGAEFVFKRDPGLKIDAGARGMIPIGYAKSFFNDKLRVGGTIKYMYAALANCDWGLVDIQDLADLSSVKDDYLTYGWGIGVDLGVLVSQPESKFQPTLGVSATNIGGIKSFSNQEKVLILPSLNTGISFKLLKSKPLTITAAADVQSINQHMDFSKKFGTGLELDIYSLIKLQAGLYNGYYTAGINFDLILINIRAATYAKEAGDYAGSIENRVYVVDFKLII